MKRLLEIIFVFFRDLVPFIRPSNRKGFTSLILLVAANSLPVIGVIFFNWHPIVLLIIYWAESAIIGIFNLVMMFISGIIEKDVFSPSGAGLAAIFCPFFLFHYGIFMLVHGVFIAVMYMIVSTGSLSGSGESEFELITVIKLLSPQEWTLRGFFKSEFSAVVALFINHLISFYMNFIRIKEYNYTTPPDYMLRPYKRIVVMHITILLGFFTIFISGLRGAGVVIIWVALKVLADLKMNMGDMAAQQKKRSEADQL
ncbi:MAG TPA: DUF6498-containing protein [Spirochaetota bacterium]|nr:DUF6498-containing protein [Spirochaetota bacterium]